jgi:hypothetical protein
VRPDEEEPHFIVVDLLIARYLLEELIASRSVVVLDRRSDLLLVA